MSDNNRKLNTSGDEALRGLSSYEVRKRVRAGAVNGDATVKTKSYGEIVSTNVFTLFHAMNLVLFVAILLFGELKNALFMIVVVCNAAIGIVQEVRAKKLIDKLSLISAPHALVVRDGVEIEVPASEIVKDDLVKYETGHQVCADSIVVQGQAEADESLITGESDAIRKAEGEELCSGSFIVSGSCFARVIHIGADNYTAKITKQAGYIKTPHSEIMLGIRRIIKTIGIAMLPLGVLLFLKQYLISKIALSDAVTKTVAALVGMIPEGLVLLTSTVLAIGIIRLSKKNALVQELYSIEMLARVDTLCLDKTGTLTKGEMEVASFYGGAKAAAAAIAYGLNEKSPTASAIRAATGCPDNLVITEEVPFSSARKWSGIRTADGKSLVMGAPSFITLDTSRMASFDEMKRFMDADEVSAKAAELTAQGFRVLLVCESREGFYEGANSQGYSSADLNSGSTLKNSNQSDKSISNYSTNKNWEAQQNLEPTLPSGLRAHEENEPVLPSGLRALGLVALSDKLRDGAPESIRFFTEEGVAIKIISGDDPVTVSNIASRCGVPGAGLYVDASKFSSKRELANAVSDYNIFGRVTPEQKLVIIQALKSAGHTVAMTGDGVNDVMALKESDCGIAPASGSDAARNVSQIVLLDSDFSSLPDVVAEGRRSINNLQRSAALFLTKTVFSIVVAFVLLFLAIDYPLEPIQLTLISALTIGVPSFVLALEPNRARVKGHFLTNVMTRALPGAFTDIVILLAGGLVMNALAFSAEQISTVSMLLLGLVGFMVLVKVCQPIVTSRKIDWLRVALIVVMLAAFVLAVALFGEFFALVEMTAPMWYAFGLFACVALLVYLGALLVVKKVLQARSR